MRFLKFLPVPLYFTNRFSDAPICSIIEEHLQKEGRSSSRYASERAFRRESDMAKLADAPLLTQEQIEEVAAFEGFSPEDFEVFEISGFDARMPALRARIKPKL